MAIDWDEMVLAPMMSADVFGENIQPTYRPAVGGSFQIDGVFDAPYLGLAMGPDGEPVAALQQPVLGVRLAQFAVLPLQGDQITIASTGKTYVVANVEPDGKGWAKLILMSTSV